ncbi:hypothetical protein KY335_02085 [Candidatus Woesearchaeota archaeon]|nr:hypothetical protein [Candidatus Woesearchaeota archaeon]
MKGMSTKNFTIALKKALDESDDPREVFLKHVEAIKKLERLDQLEDLELVAHSSYKHPMKEGEFCFDVHYVAQAVEGFYPRVRQKLIDAGIVGLHNVTQVRTINKGKPDELEELKLNFYGNRFHLILHVRDPQYRHM